MSKVGISATVNEDTHEKLVFTMRETGRSKSQAVEMLLSYGYEKWLEEKSKAIAIKAGVKA